MDMFECNMLSGEFPADYDTMVRTSPTYDEDLEYLQNSAVSFSQLLRADNLGPQRQRGQREEMDSPELDEDWLRDLLSSEDSFDPDFLENIDMDSLEHWSVLYEGGRDLVEEVGVSVSTSQDIIRPTHTSHTTPHTQYCSAITASREEDSPQALI